PHSEQRRVWRAEDGPALRHWRPRRGGKERRGADPAGRSHEGPAPAGARRAMIWDLHCHLNGVTGRTPHERMAHLIELADRMGIDRMCLYMGMQFESDPSPEQIRQQNDEALQALEHWRHRA